MNLIIIINKRTTSQMDSKSSWFGVGLKCRWLVFCFWNERWIENNDLKMPSIKCLIFPVREKKMYFSTKSLLLYLNEFYYRVLLLLWEFKQIFVWTFFLSHTNTDSLHINLYSHFYFSPYVFSLVYLIILYWCANTILIEWINCSLFIFKQIHVH